MRYSPSAATLWLLLVAGCAGAPDAGRPGAGSVPAVDGMVIRNELPYPVTGVMIEVPATGAFAGCGNILPRTECSTTFQELSYRGNPLVVSWSEYGEPHHTGEIVLKAPADFQPGQTLRLEVVVYAPGQAGARLVPAR